MNLIVDPILTLSGGEKVSLPELFAEMARGQAGGFPALRPHQRPAWHMFLVQLGALALWTAERNDLPEEAEVWAVALRGLTPDHADDAPWQLAVKDWSKPAFLQAPAPDGLKWSEVMTPDALDMLITARNHDLKWAVARRAAEEDWVYALVSLQTCEGYGGKWNYGIARMNSGASSRPLLGLAPARTRDSSVDPSAWWARDVKRLIAARREDPDNRTGEPSLLWCMDWPEAQQLDLRNLDPWFIEVCRRVRLTHTDGEISALRAKSKSPRIDAKALKGNTDDAWAPVHHADGKSLTLGGGDFDYRRLCDLLFSGDWKKPLLARPANHETDDMLLVAEAFSRGNSKTWGFKSRIVPVPGHVIPLFSSETPAMLAKAQMEEIKGFDMALGYALALTAASGGDIEKKHYAHAVPARRRFDHSADRLFFRSLWRRVGVHAERDDAIFQARRAFLAELMSAAEVEMNAALPAMPCPKILRPRAEARARRAFRNRVWKLHPELFDRERTDDAA